MNEELEVSSSQPLYESDRYKLDYFLTRNHGSGHSAVSQLSLETHFIVWSSI